jgi:hypothetical protein
VDPGNTTRLAAAITAKGGQVQSQLYPGVGHVGVVLAISPLFRGKAPVLDQMLDFMDIMPAKNAAKEASRPPAQGAYAS